MQAEISKPEDRDIQEADLTWEGKHYYRGISQGAAETLRRNIADLADPFGFELTAERQGRLAAMTKPELETLWRHLITHRTWPADR